MPEHNVTLRGESGTEAEMEEKGVYPRLNDHNSSTLVQEDETPLFVSGGNNNHRGGSRGVPLQQRPAQQRPLLPRRDNTMSTQCVNTRRGAAIQRFAARAKDDSAPRPINPSDSNLSLIHI